MSRPANDLMQECPTCKHPLDAKAHEALGLRDFEGWVNPLLPGRVGGMDIDFCLSNARSGRTLFIEEKNATAPILMGERLAYRSLVRAGHDVWFARNMGDRRARVGMMDRAGAVPFWQDMSFDDLGRLVREWWDASGEDR